MPTYEDLILALSKADQAGNMSDAQEIAGLIRELYPNGFFELSKDIKVKKEYFMMLLLSFIIYLNSLSFSNNISGNS